MSPFNQTTVRPCLLVAHRDALYVAMMSRAFRRLGWDVYPAHNSGEARRLARMLTPDLVLLGADFPDETGWLVCDKMRRDLPEVRVFVIAETNDEVNGDFGRFVGARGVVTRTHSAESILQELHGKPFSLAS